jgi:hypothetical protein
MFRDILGGIICKVFRNILDVVENIVVTRPSLCGLQPLAGPSFGGSLFGGSFLGGSEVLGGSFLGGSLFGGSFLGGEIVVILRRRSAN